MVRILILCLVGLGSASACLNDGLSGLAEQEFTGRYAVNAPKVEQPNPWSVRGLLAGSCLLGIAVIVVGRRQGWL